jgi:hypothetical protein
MMCSLTQFEISEMWYNTCNYQTKLPVQSGIFKSTLLNSQAFVSHRDLDILESKKSD